MLTDFARSVLVEARRAALESGRREVGAAHILAALVAAAGSGRFSVLRELGVDGAALLAAIPRSPGRGESSRAPGPFVPYDEEAERVLRAAATLARERGSSSVWSHDLWMALATEPTCVSGALRESGITAERLVDALRRRPQDDRSPFERCGPAWFVRLDPDSAAPPYRQIVDQIAEAVAAGWLAPGERLPSVRDLAEELDLAPGTVARAYSELESMGVVETRGARGTHVASAVNRRRDVRGRLERMLRPVVVRAYHMGATADDVRRALEASMTGIYQGRLH
jgi:GntR family transcriptional regulator